MSEKIDNIIVGGGIGGVICGAYLAKAGLKTVVFEKSAEIGGRAHSHKFDGYTGTKHGVTWFSMWDGGFWPRAARELDVDIKFYAAPYPKTYIRGSGTFLPRPPICHTPKTLTEYFTSIFSMQVNEDEKEEINKIIREMVLMPYKRLYDEFDTVLLPDWLAERTKNNTVKKFFSNLCGSMTGSDMKKIYDIFSTASFFALVRGVIAGEGTFTFIVDLVEELVKPFAEVIVDHEGKIETNHEVKEVIIEGGVAKGVVVRDGRGKEKTYKADRVIANSCFTDIPKIFKKMPGEVAEAVKAMGEAVNVSYTIFYGLKQKVTESTEIVMVVDPVTKENQSLCQLSNVIPGFAPPGKALLICFWSLDREKANKRKAQEIYEIMDDVAEEVYPGVRKAVEVKKKVFDPIGWHHQYSAAKKIPSKSSSVQNLYFVGDGTTPQYGIAIDGVASTGMLCAKQILNSIGK